MALVLLLLGGCFAPAGRPATLAAPARIGVGELYLALGDSLGAGMLTSLPDTRGYVPQLHALLEQHAGRPVQLRNLSVPGETTKSLLADTQLKAALAALQEAQGYGWRVSPITLDIGGNDLLAVRHANEATREAALAEFRANLAQIFDQLVAATTLNGARVSDLLTMTIYNPYGGDPAVAHSLAWWVERFNAALVEEATRREITVASVYQRFRGQEQALTWMPTDFHANNRGHRAIAEEFWRATGYDTVPPTVEVLEPAGERPVRPVTTIKVRASDGAGPVRIELFADDKPLPPPLFQPAFNLSIGYWDARSVAPGAHRLSIVVTDLAGNATRREVTVQR